jgi:predicted porin
MKKSLIALAALAATGAFAQSTVTIYGRAHVAYDAMYSATGAAAGASADVKTRRRVADDGSRIGLRITEDLGGGLRAFSVIETGLNIDNAGDLGQAGTANSGTGYFGTREAHVGVGNAMAELRLGRQNVYWGNGPIEDVGANRISGGIGGSVSAASSGFVSVPAARLENTVQIVGGSNLGGFAGSSIWFAHPNNAERTAAGKDVKQTAQGFTLRYVTGPFAAQVDMGQNKNTNNGVDTAATYAVTGAAGNTVTTKLGGATYNRTDKATKIGLAYTYAPGSKVYFVNTNVSHAFTDATANAATPTTLGSTTLEGYRKQASNQIGVQHRLGAIELHGQYAKVGNIKNAAGATVADTGATAYAVGVRYELSKRTAITSSYNIIDNAAKNNLNISGGGQSSTATIGAGANLKVLRASIQHQF